jgi:hypothetical protein
MRAKPKREKEHRATAATVGDRPPSHRRDSVLGVCVRAQLRPPPTPFSRNKCAPTPTRRRSPPLFRRPCAPAENLAVPTLGHWQQVRANTPRAVCPPRPLRRFVCALPCSDPRTETCAV